MGDYLRITFDGRGEGWTWSLRDASGLALWTTHSSFVTEDEARLDARQALAVIFRFLAESGEPDERRGETRRIRRAPPRYHETPSIARRRIHR